MQVICLSFFLVGAKASGDETRQGFLAKLGHAYREGRESAAEKRIVKRKAEEKLRKRLVFERNVKVLVDGISRRIKSRPRQLPIFVIGCTILAVWLCLNNSLGCNRSKD